MNEDNPMYLTELSDVNDANPIPSSDAHTVSIFTAYNYIRMRLLDYIDT